METIIIKNNEYILVENIFNKAPVYCKESRNGRELIKNKKITDYIYAKIKKVFGFNQMEKVINMIRYY